MKEFVFLLQDEAKIAAAHLILDDPHSARRHTRGKIILLRADYDLDWFFHLAPATIDFFEIQIELCASNITYIEGHLDEAGSSFCPSPSGWCPGLRT